jgi:hypothetical protein
MSWLHARCAPLSAHLSPSPSPSTPSRIHRVLFDAGTSSNSFCCGEESPSGPRSALITASGGEPGVAWIDAGKQSRECEFTGESHSDIDAASSSCRVTQYSQEQAGSGAPRPRRRAVRGGPPYNSTHAPGHAHTEGERPIACIYTTHTCNVNNKFLTASTLLDKD